MEWSIRHIKCVVVSFPVYQVHEVCYPHLDTYIVKVNKRVCTVWACDVQTKMEWLIRHIKCVIITFPIFQIHEVCYPHFDAHCKKKKCTVGAYPLIIAWAGSF